MSAAPWNAPGAANIAGRLVEMAQWRPEHPAVLAARGAGPDGRGRYLRMTFRELHDDSGRLAQGLLAAGAQPGMRIALLVRPGLDFISLVFALFKAGLVVVLIDPGLGRRTAIRCLAEAEPEGFVAIPQAHALRVLLRGRFPKARVHVTVGRRWFWGGPTLAELRARGGPGAPPAAVDADTAAAILFTSGGTGAPKGVLYRHGNFQQQVDEIRDRYGIEPGGVDLSGFPLFALFNAGMGVTTVWPEMDFTRPAQADPRKIVAAITDCGATQAFGSPALWNVVGRHCEEQGLTLPTLRQVFTAGAPAPVHVLRRMSLALAPDAEMHTPYGATEALPVASISAREVLGETAARTAVGAGTCVGMKFPGIEWRVIQIRDEPLPTLAEAAEAAPGEIGELIVTGPQVTTEYATRREANALAKIRDGARVWHRLGDTGYLDDAGRFWFCGRKVHRVRTAAGTLFPLPCEAIFNAHPRVFRSALVGIGPPGEQTPAIVFECWPGQAPRGKRDLAALIAELRALGAAHAHTRGIGRFHWRKTLPVDIRHNVKIDREQLARWAAKQDGGQ